MYEFFRGKLAEKGPNHVVLDVQGVGYKLFIPLNAHVLLPDLKKEVFFYACCVVREDAHTLYGFLKKEEKDLFELLLSVSGIGPKSALALIGHLDLSTFYQALQTQNVAWIAKTPGIGKKTAERLIIELKDKVKTNLNSKSGVVSDAIGALLHLGYNLSVAQKAVENAYKEKNSPEDLGLLITEALKRI